MSALAAPGWDEDLLRRTVASLAAVMDGDEPIDELAHALQCATHAMAVGSAPEGRSPGQAPPTPPRTALNVH